MTGFLARNWVWIGFVVLFLAMHRAGYGCGMHGAHGHHDHHESDSQATDDRTPSSRTSATKS